VRPSRAEFRSIVYTLVVFLPLLAAGPAASAQPIDTPLDRESRDAMSPDDALAELQEGNARFVAGEGLERDWLAQAKGSTGGQYPFASILSCVDSRVPPEIVFDQGIGDLFVARIAGNFITTDLLGSLEFTTAAAGSRLIVVLGHTACGAIRGACDGVQLGNLTHTLSQLYPAVYATTGVPGPRSSENTAFVDAVTRTNVEQTVRNIVERSPVIAARVKDGQLRVVGALYDLATGKVTFLEAESEESEESSP
jgi:carbonic anhydrase